jgi:hypothetical protein
VLDAIWQHGISIQNQSSARQCFNEQWNENVPCTNSNQSIIFIENVFKVECDEENRYGYSHLWTPFCKI